MPPYLTYGMRRRPSSSSSRSEWWPVRISTACSRSATPRSCAASTRSAPAVADDGQATVVATKRVDDVDLERVDVLILVDEQMVEHRRQARAGGLVPCECPPVQQQVVQVERLRRPLALAVADEEARDLVAV